MTAFAEPLETTADLWWGGAALDSGRKSAPDGVGGRAEAPRNAGKGTTTVVAADL
jgi:hypothetical protein